MVRFKIPWSPNDPDGTKDPRDPDLVDPLANGDVEEEAVEDAPVPEPEPEPVPTPVDDKDKDKKPKKDK